MAFLETPRFPITIGFGSTGGPGYRTSVVVLDSGHEKRNQIWEFSRGRWDVASGVKSQNTLEQLVEFFHAVRGREHGFRYKDLYDFKSSTPGGETGAAEAFDDQSIGIGDGTSPQTAQLKKTYTRGSLSTERQIRKPVSGTVLIGIAGVQDTGIGGHWSVDTTTGIVTFIDQTDDVTGATPGNPTSFNIPGHNLETGDTAHFSTFSGDWAALNGLRFQITKTDADNFTIDFDSSSFAAYNVSTDGGTTHTVPQVGESITAGFQFDVPARFDTDQLPASLDTYRAGQANVPIVEIRV